MCVAAKEKKPKHDDGVDGVVNPAFAALLPGDSQEEMEKWIAQRRKKFPTQARTVATVPALPSPSPPFHF